MDVEQAAAAEAMEEEEEAAAALDAQQAPPVDWERLDAKSLSDVAAAAMAMGAPHGRKALMRMVCRWEGARCQPKRGVLRSGSRGGQAPRVCGAPLW